MRPVLFIAVIMLAALIGFNRGYNRGFDKAEVIGVAKNIEMTKHMMASCSDDMADAYQRGQDAAKYECDQMVQLGERVCQMDVKRMYQRGQVDGMKRIGKLCGIKIK